MNALFACFILASANFAVVSCSAGTTANLKAIFLGRCYDYVQLKSNVSLLGRKNCSSLYQTFEDVFSNKTTCKTDYSAKFDGFFKQVDPGSTSNNKALFWSGTKNVAHSLSSSSDAYITLEDTLPGYIANNLNFCGENTKGFNYVSCSCHWNESQLGTFWRAASVQFAKNARGVVHVLVNGTRRDGEPAFRNTSTFAEVELPNLNAKEVKEVKIFVGVDLDIKPKEKCGKESIKTMQKLIEQRDIKVKCFDDPRVVFFVLCTKYPRDHRCMTVLTRLFKDSDNLKMWKIIAFCLIGACTLLIIILVTILCLKRKYSQFK